MKRFVLLAILPALGFTLLCYNCQTSYEVEGTCSTWLPYGNFLECDGEGAQCYQSIEWFQNGSLRLVRRGCYKPGNKTGSYCTNYDNPVGELKSCKTCERDLCNMEKILKMKKACVAELLITMK